MASIRHTKWLNLMALILRLLYDAEKTAELFCLMINRWRALEAI